MSCFAGDMSNPTDGAVAALYDALPYPARDPRDESRRLLIGSPGHPTEIDHYLFGGARDWTRPFRALFAGGGTGDGCVMLAQLLADRGVPAEVIHLEPSAPAQAVARARAAARGLASIRFVAGTIEALPSLGLSGFDYIDCCGVLHHLADPQAGLSALAATLAPDGGIGAMVYGRLGRAGVYEMQACLRDLVGGAPMAEQVSLGRKLLADLPATAPLKRNPVVRDHIDGGDAGFADLLLHPRDCAYNVAEVADLVTGAGLRLIGFLAPLQYDPLTYVRHPELRKRLSALPALERMAFAERFAGNLARHVFYATKGGANPPTLSDDVVPILRDLDAAGLAQAVGTSGQLVLTLDGLDLALPLPRVAGALFKLIDGKRSVDRLAAEGQARGALSKDEAAARRLVVDCLDPLVRANLLQLKRAD
jgi:SAM-dependent methyltransferase